MATKTLTLMERAVLIETFALENRQVSGPTHSDIMSSLLTVNSAVTERAISFALATLEARKLIIRYLEDGEFGGRSLHFRASGIGSEWVLTELSNGNIDLENFASASHTEPEIPASDRVVTLDHNSAAYKEATEKLDQVIDLVERDMTNDFDDKEQRVSELKAGRELLKSHSVNLKTIITVLGSCLTYLAIKFADVASGDMAGLAWASIKSLFGY